MLSLTQPMSMVVTDYPEESAEEVNEPSILRGRGCGCGRKMQ